jgi:hypothetical protein
MMRLVGITINVLNAKTIIWKSWEALRIDAYASRVSTLPKMKNPAKFVLNLVRLALPI